MADLGKEIGWDDAIENEGTEPLPEGTYEFTVASMERAHFGGSEKMAPCNVANLDLLIKDKDGKEHHVFDSLYLNYALDRRRKGKHCGLTGMKCHALPARWKS